MADDKAKPLLPSGENRDSWQFHQILLFLRENPEFAPRAKKSDSLFSESYVAALASRYQQGLSPRSPQAPKTVSDPMVSVVLEVFFSLPSEELPRVALEHSQSMAAENIVGDLLERYIAQVMEPMGWVWCAGDVVRKIDFLVKGSTESPALIPMQIKNRDNTENSSSAAIRDGTRIEKWFRTFSRSGKTNWSALPYTTPGVELSEEGFVDFARSY